MSEQNIRDAIAQAPAALRQLLINEGLVKLKGPSWLHKFITENEEMKRMKQKALALMDMKDPVLIYGESGTGKEIIANALHGDRGGAFIPVNCAGLPEQLVESELFGHVMGSFTGATHHKTGLFEAAQNGTLFIDEIGELPLSVQPKLLRVIQDRKVRRVGSTNFTDINCRVVCATHRPLEQWMVEGKFREDLYWRLATYTLTITPLRTRVGDIHEIFDRILDADGQLTPEQRDEISSCNLSGNFRELEAKVKRMLLEKKLAQ